MNIEKMKTSVMHVVGKCITVGGVVFLSQGGMDVLIAYIELPSDGNFLPLKALSLIAVYAIWTKAIVPFFSGIIEGKETAGKTKAIKTAYCSLI